MDSLATQHPIKEKKKKSLKAEGETVPASDAEEPSIAPPKAKRSPKPKAEMSPKPPAVKGGQSPVPSNIQQPVDVDEDMGNSKEEPSSESDFE